MYSSQAAIMSQMVREAGTCQQARSGRREQRARQKYAEMRLHATLGRIVTALRGGARHPLSLAAFRPVAAGCRGVRTVPLSQIRGSEGRCADMDAQFRLIHGATKDRWLRVADAHQQKVNLPPVTLVQVGDVYYVRDGHHRVSVALAWGQESIDAEVVEWQVEAGPIVSASA